MDRLSPEKRSWLMSRVLSSNTKPELAVRCLLHKMGYRFRIYGRELPGKPDIVFTKRRKIIFVHGCFWHGHAECRYAKLPKSRIQYWREKIERNCKRDDLTEGKLREMGWEVFVIWQCEIRDMTSLEKQLIEFLGPTKYEKVQAT